MWVALVDFWSIDPLPVPPDVPRDSMAWWRWWTNETLKARGVAVSYDTWKTRVPDDHPSVEDEHGEGRCECCCDSCGDALVLHPDYGYLQCGDCHGGRSVADTGDALRASMVAARRLK